MPVASAPFCATGIFMSEVPEVGPRSTRFSDYIGCFEDWSRVGASRFRTVANADTRHLTRDTNDTNDTRRHDVSFIVFLASNLKHSERLAASSNGLCRDLSPYRPFQRTAANEHPLPKGQKVVSFGSLSPAIPRSNRHRLNEGGTT